MSARSAMPASADATTPRNAIFSEIADSVRRVLRRAMIPLCVAAAVEVGALFMKGNPAALAFTLIASSSLLVLGIWGRRGKGLPLVALLAAQNLAIYALPIVVGNEGVMRYPPEYLTQAGWEIACFNVAILLAWQLAMRTLPNYSGMCYALLGFEQASAKLTHLGMTLLVVGSGYEILNSLNLLWIIVERLPAGSTSLLHALFSAVSGCGFFICGMMVGKRQVTPLQRVTFWSLLGIQCFITASGFLLSAAIMVVFSSMIGLFWGSGKIPLRYLTITVVAIGFLNLGKFTMREKYWNAVDGGGAEFALSQMPSIYTEWAGASVDVLTGKNSRERNHNAFGAFGATDPEATDNGQSLLQRINNLENLLFVVDAVKTRHVPPLGGSTYSLIPPLLVPRLLWPDKPRSHEGQVLLNVYFGRQDLNSTFRTYIAWGLLPEAYGNFGPITGALLLGAALGLMFAWIEKFVARKLVLSLEGFLSFTLFVGIADSYEMVASVLVTSLFQGFVPIILASSPFVARIMPKSSVAPEAPTAPTP